MTTDTATYRGGPLDGQELGTPARSVYRDHTGAPKPANWGDRRLIWRTWQPGENGLYSRDGKGYRWHTKH